MTAGGVAVGQAEADAACAVPADTNMEVGTASNVTVIVVRILVLVRVMDIMGEN